MATDECLTKIEGRWILDYVRFFYDVMIIRNDKNQSSIVSVLGAAAFIVHLTKNVPPDKGAFVDQSEVDNLRGYTNICCTSRWAALIYATVKYYKYQTPDLVGACEIATRLQTSRMENVLTDCALQVKRRKLVAHRCILSAHSEVFRAMFTHQETSESLNGVIDLGDSSIEAVEAMLNYVYGASVEELRKCSVEVYKLADKYGIPHLKHRCYELLRDEVPEDEFCSLLELAYLMSSEDLMKLCEDFVKRHQKFLRTSEWQEFRKKNPDAAFLMYDKMH